MESQVFNPPVKRILDFDPDYAVAETVTLPNGKFKFVIPKGCTFTTYLEAKELKRKLMQESEHDESYYKLVVTALVEIEG